MRAAIYKTYIENDEGKMVVVNNCKVMFIEFTFGVPPNHFGFTNGILGAIIQTCNGKVYFVELKDITFVDDIFNEVVGDNNG